jgi:hypothetical protein
VCVAYGGVLGFRKYLELRGYVIKCATMHDPMDL